MRSPEDKYVDMVKDIVLSRVDQDRVTVFLFGSRAQAGHPPRTDVDVGFLGDERLAPRLLHDIRNAIEDSIVPLNVDLVDFHGTPPEFRAAAFKGAQIWNMPMPSH